MHRDLLGAVQLTQPRLVRLSAAVIEASLTASVGDASPASQPTNQALQAQLDLNY